MMSYVFWINQNQSGLIILFTLGYIYEATDKVLLKNVALKIEKKDKNKSILIFEYNVLQTLQGKFRRLRVSGVYLHKTRLCTSRQVLVECHQQINLDISDDRLKSLWKYGNTWKSR
jgi:hypothetical protein